MTIVTEDGRGLSFVDEAQDAVLRERILRFLHTRGIVGLENIEVDVDGGVASLHGRVPSSYDRWLCVKSARRVAGIIRVENNIEIADDGRGHAKRRPR